jgi:death-on-curing protein
MEGTGGEIVYPSHEQILDINRRLVEEFGGLFLKPDNVLNQGALEYILEAIKAKLFGVELYPTLLEKASALGFHIITGHIFNDGNKRTGVYILLEFLESNGVKVKLDRSVVDLAVKIAQGEAEEKDLVDWIILHIE